MGIDAQLMALLDGARNATARPLRELSLDEARDAYRERYLQRGIAAEDEHAEAAQGKDAQAGEALEIELAGRRLGARLHRPGAVPRPPLLVYFHGGGYVLGDAIAYANQSRALARMSGTAILDVEYRLAPEHPFPAAVEDARDAYLWAKAHAAELGCDAARVGVGGDSAGGALAAVTALSCGSRGQGPCLALLLYPWTDCRPYCGGLSYPSVESFSAGHFLDRETMEWFARYYLPSPEIAEDERASPLLWRSSPRLPTTILVTAEYDPLCDMGTAFAQAMRHKGEEVQLICAGGMIHNFMGFAGVSRGARMAFEDVGQRLREGFGRP